MAEFKDLSATDASNVARFPEGMRTNAVNNSARALEGMVAREFKDRNGSLNSTGSANAYILAANATLTAYAQGDEFSFKANFGNTSAATINVDSVGVKSIKKHHNIALASGDIESGALVTVVYDGTNFQLMSPTAADASVSAAAALVSENAAAADLVLTNADVVSTNADVVSTTADAAATALDKIATNADVVLTAADVVSTAADLVLTDADQVSAAASASTATAKEILTNADAVATAADAVATGNDKTATNADAVSTAADAVATGNDKTATNADVVLTNADVVSAEAAKVAAELALDSFDDRYLGTKSSDPSLDNDGAALIDGAMYYNTTSNVMKVYDLGTTSWLTFNVASSSATTTSEGIVELLTTAEAITGTDTTRAMTAAAMHGALAGLADTTIVAGDAIVFSDASDSGALKEDTVQGILDLVPAASSATTTAEGIVERSTSGENVAGTSDTVYPTVLGAKEMIDTHASGGSNPNLIINGGMTVSQRGTSFVSPVNAAYTIDRWRYSTATTGARVTITQDTTSNVFSALGADTCMKIDCTTADAFAGSADTAFVVQKIEGQNCQDIRAGTAGAQEVTLSFLFQSPKAGTHCVALYTSANRACPTEFTVASANTPELISVTFPADTANSIVNSSADGLHVVFPLMLGDSFEGTADSWSNTGEKYITSNQQELLDNVANNIYIGNIKLETGSSATAFQHESYGDTLLKCYRYYRSHTIPATNYAFIVWPSTTKVGRSAMRPDVPMRGTPSVVFTASDWRMQFNLSATTVDLTNWTIGAGDGGRNWIMTFTMTAGTFTDGSVMVLADATADRTYAFNAEL